jgi:hypothetical protein
MIQVRPALGCSAPGRRLRLARGAAGVHTAAAGAGTQARGRGSGLRRTVRVRWSHRTTAQRSAAVRTASAAMLHLAPPLRARAAAQGGMAAACSGDESARSSHQGCSRAAARMAAARRAAARAAAAASASARRAQAATSARGAPAARIRPTHPRQRWAVREPHSLSALQPARAAESMSCTTQAASRQQRSAGGSSPQRMPSSSTVSATAACAPRHARRRTAPCGPAVVARANGIPLSSGAAARRRCVSARRAPGGACQPGTVPGAAPMRGAASSVARLLRACGFASTALSVASARLRMCVTGPEAREAHETGASGAADMASCAGAECGDLQTPRADAARRATITRTVVSTVVCSGWGRPPPSA